MSEKRALNIAQVSTADLGGGAENIALGLHQAYRALGHPARLAVGRRLSREPGVIALPSLPCQAAAWTRMWLRLSWYAGLLPPAINRRLRLPGVFRMAACPRAFFERRRGVEDFNYPLTWSLLNMEGGRPDILQCHNLHGGYFDLRALPWLSTRVPVVLTLHDAWLLSGHCAHSFSCERWRTGCGRCPDLSIYPAVRRDATAANWERKRSLFAGSRLYAAAPCQWLLDRVSGSMLAPGLKRARVIPNGIDLSLFSPGDRPALRAALGLPAAAQTLLFPANGLRNNPWRDFDSVMHAARALAERPTGRQILLLGLGAAAEPITMNGVEVRFLPFERDPGKLAGYYQAADAYLHISKADTFPTAVIEAMGCALPVIASRIGGIPEQVDEGRTGYLIGPQDVAAIVDCVRRLADEGLARGMGEAGRVKAMERFELKSQAQTYLNWFYEILEAA